MKNEITITIRYGGEKQSVPTMSDIVLEDLLSQLSRQGRLPQSQGWVATKSGEDTALDLAATLADNKITDGDVLDLALDNKAG